LTGRWLEAEEARRIKLVNRVLPRPDLYAEADKLARLIQELDPGVVAAAKQAVTRGLDMSLAEGLDLEKRLGHLFIRSS
jgi:enoyl-CoA hydratase/carnithine racemase